ncbi:MAG: entericidin A/B family lipoprotein [Verrucomicrobiales bacterium]
MKPTFTTLIWLVIASSFLAGCRTTRGLGRDIQHLGAKIEEEAAEKTHD